jgi:hypothetical protein
MASKIDKVLDRLERLTDDVNNLKRKAIPLLPVPPLVKSALRTGTQRLDDVITDTYFDTVRGVADVVLPVEAARAAINDPDIIMADDGQMFRRSTGRQEIFNREPVKKPRKVTKKMKQQRKIQSTAFKNANAQGRLQNGSFRAGYDQSRIARMAQKECTRERIRLGLCEDPKKKKGRRQKK